MRLLFSTIIFFCFATASAQCTYGDIEITVTGETYKRIILTNTATGEAFQSYDTSSSYDQLPEALNSVSQWEPVSFGTDFTPNLSIIWDGYSIVYTNQSNCLAGGICGDGCDNSADCFEADLLSLSGEFSVQSDGSIMLDLDPNSLVDPNNTNGDIEVTVTGETYKRIILTNTVTGEAFQSSGTSSTYDQLPAALNSVSEWELVSFGTDFTPNLSISWDGYSILNTTQTQCMAQMFLGCCDSSSDRFESNLLSLTGEFSVQPDGSVLLLYCDAPVGFCDCNGGVLDECGVCGGDNSTCTDCAGVVNGEAVEDCAGVCGGASVIDECGVCGGGGIADGACDCDGNIIDECGECDGDNSSCSGCANENATNYDLTATIDDGSCMYDQDAYDSGVASVDITSNDQEVYDGAYAAGVASVVCPDGGSSCPGDLDNDGAVATTDLLIFLSAYGGTCDSGDVIVGCTYPAAVEYNPSANVDDGSCTFPVDCAGVLNGTSLVDGCGTCDADASNDCFLCGDDITHEGYDYSTVLIGDQCWFSENCRYLPIVSDPSIDSTTEPHYYVYGYTGTDVEDAKGTSNYETYGVLYNWPAVITEGICPSGWHIPSDGEFTELTDFLGGSSIAGEQMKSTSGWNENNGSNSSGFDGLPGGYAGFGGFDNDGYLGFWWSSSAEVSSSAWRRHMQGNGNNVFRYDGSRNEGYSARCVRD